MPVDPLSIASSAAGGIASLIQIAGSIGQEGRANKQLNNLFKQRKKFQTPEEVFKILQMQQYNSQTGFSADTMDYLTGQADRSLSASLGTALRLGADSSVIGGILDSNFENIFKTGYGNELEKMKKFDGLINAELLLAQNNEAKQIWDDNLIKDQMAALATKVQGAKENLQSGVNLGLNTLTTLATNNLYNEDGTLKTDKRRAQSRAATGNL